MGPNRIWNIDETAIDGEYRVLQKVFGPSHTNLGGLTFTTIGSKKGRHVSAVFRASASCRVLSPYSIVQAKSIMKNRFLPLSKALFNNKDGSPFRVKFDNWMSNDAVIKCSVKGTMDL